MYVLCPVPSVQMGKVYGMGNEVLENADFYLDSFLVNFLRIQNHCLTSRDFQVLYTTCKNDLSTNIKIICRYVTSPFSRKPLLRYLVTARGDGMSTPCV